MLNQEQISQLICVMPVITVLLEAQCLSKPFVPPVVTANKAALKDCHAQPVTTTRELEKRLLRIVNCALLVSIVMDLQLPPLVEIACRATTAFLVQESMISTLLRQVTTRQQELPLKLCALPRLTTHITTNTSARLAMLVSIAIRLE